MHGNADRTGAGLYQPQQGTELCGYLLRQWIYGNKFQAACIYPPDERCAAEENQVHRGSAWIFYLLGSVLLATAILSYLMQQSQGVEALQMLIGGFVIFMIPQVVGSVVVLLELAAVMLRQVWYI